ncbi:MFS transporter [Kibdelosporangium philippinense]|uniref:MFS transporter n=1 Tax=Kibdelosporangium philippinense TaxID=211113 RepID=A0ABS8YZT6_9PSEU|nr:MFS transporter [Kibdelosporangium philippinense]MCE7001238.1 MFS transporter [Kibdelosporangium philippinense]
MRGLKQFLGFGVGRSTWILAACQAFYFMGISIDLTLTAIVGLKLAPTPELATVPLAAITIVGTLCSVGTGLLAARIGYVAVMVLGACAAAAGGALSVFAVVNDSFVLLCCGTGLVGAYRSTGGYIRYMAADRAPGGQRERALSFILYGGLVAAFVGPFVATTSADFLGVQYAGAYVMVAVFALTNVPLMLLLRAGSSRPHEQVDKQEPVPLSTVRGSREFYTGLMSLAAAGGLMTMIMAVGPLANHHAGHSESVGAAIIQWHLVGMFAPAIVSGHILSKIGPQRTGMIGAGLFAAAAIAGLTGTGSANFVLALALNGIGWNFLYLAGTTLLVRSYPPGRGGRIQAVAEGTAQVTGVAASLTASSVFVLLGWHGTNWPVFGISLVLLLVLFVTRTSRSTEAVLVPVK